MVIATGLSPENPYPDRQEPIGQILKRMELINEAQVQEALEIQRKRGGVIGQILVGMGHVAQEEVMLALAEQLGSAPDTVRFEVLDPPAENAPLRDDFAHWDPAVKLVNLILLTSIKAGATELRLEVIDEKFTIRYRVDGVLYDMESPPLQLGHPVIGRLLSETGIDISQRTRPQERRAMLISAARLVHVIAVYTPGNGGESVVLHFSDP